MIDPTATDNVIVSAFYHFCSIESPAQLRKTLLHQVARYNMTGTILVAAEGINGTIAGSRSDTDLFFEQLRADNRFVALKTKESRTKKAPFLRAKVKIKMKLSPSANPILIQKIKQALMSVQKTGML